MPQKSKQVRLILYGPPVTSQTVVFVESIYGKVFVILFVQRVHEPWLQHHATIQSRFDRLDFV